MNLLLVVTAVIGVLIIFNTVSGMLGNRGITMVDAAGAKKLTEDSDIAIIDVRTPQEYKNGHLRMSRLIPVNEIGRRAGEIESLKDSPVLVYCRSGHRSTIAARILKKRGFTRVSNMTGGIIAWQAAGYEVTKK